MDNAILNKIKRLLALSYSSNVNEASVALSKAHELLKMHNLSMNDIAQDNPYSILEEGYLTGERIPLWKTLLIVEVCNANYCTCLKEQKADNFVMKIVGKDINILATRIMLDYLMQTIDRLAHKFAARDRKSYKTGVVNALSARLRLMNLTEATECKALVVQEKATVDKYLESKKNVTTALVRATASGTAFYTGMRDGNGISLNQQVSVNKTNQVRG